jgi:hypothetical protein
MFRAESATSTVNPEELKLISNLSEGFEVLTAMVMNSTYHLLGYNAV